MRRRALLLAALAPRDCALAVRVRDGATLRSDNPRAAHERLLEPGSTVKPIVLPALRRHAHVRCTGQLTLAGRRLDCTHAPLAEPLDAETALALSCNAWFAAMAQLADPVEIHHALVRAGAECRLARTAAQLQLQALGLELLRFTPLALAAAYRRIALAGQPVVRAGLARAAREGTAQLVQIDGLSIAGKTGTTGAASWFAGYAPVERPSVVVVVQLIGGRGALDAAPLAREVFAWWRASA